MTSEQRPFDGYVEASAKALELTLAPEWKEAARVNIETIFRLSDLVEGCKLPDDIEPAPIFEA
jgi:Protein of unknown function (DUF4089)